VRAEYELKANHERKEIVKKELLIEEDFNASE
jgi:hypothetical protein